MKLLQAVRQWFSLSRLLTICLVGLMVVTTTACNQGDLRGARPNNPPVQMGGQNNPHKQGGDNYNDYQMSDDPAVNDLSLNAIGSAATT